MTQLTPPKLLKGSLSFVNYTTDKITDTSSPLYGKYQSWEYNITVLPTNTSYPGPRKDYQYNGLDVDVGDWVSSSIGGYACQITAIMSQTSTNLDIILTDVNNYNAIGDSSGNGNGALKNGDCFIFEVNNNRPILTPEVTGTFSSVFGTDMISRFYYTNPETSSGDFTNMNNIKINWSPSNKVNPNDVIMFTLPTGVDFYVYSVEVSSPMTIECHQTGAYADTNPYKFVAVDGNLIDDGSYVSNGQRYYGPRYAFLQNTQDRQSDISYWKLTYTGSISQYISIIFYIASINDSLTSTTIVYDNS